MKCAAISFVAALVVLTGVYFILPSEIEFTDSVSDQTTVYDSNLVRLAPAATLGALAGIVAFILALRRLHPKGPSPDIGEDPFGLDPGVTPKTIEGGLFQVVARYLSRKR
jgi:hypothetical protein